MKPSSSRLARHVSALCIYSTLLTIPACSRADEPAAASISSEALAAAPPAIAPPTAAAAPAPVAAPAAAPGTGTAAAEEPLAARGGRMVISEATLSLRADPDEAAETATRLVTARGGYVANKSATGADGGASAVSLVLRVPAAELEPVLSALRRTGTLLSESQSGQDVTAEYTDTQAQLRAKRRLEERLLAIVASAKSVKEMLEVETELARVRTDIERLDGRSRTLAGQVAFATINVSYVAPSQPVVVEAETSWSKIRHALAEARQASLHAVLGMIVVVGAVSPFVVMGAAFVYGILWLKRRRRAALPADPV